LKDSSPPAASLFTRRAALGALSATPLMMSTLAGCGSRAALADGATSSSAPVPPDLKRKLNALVRQLGESNLLSGAILVDYNGRTVFAAATGMADRQQTRPNQHDTIFALGSTSKSFTALAVTQLAERGKIDFHAPLGKYLGGFPASIAGTVTINQLLTHTSGMGDVLGSSQVRRERQSWHSPEQELNGLMSIIRTMPLISAPGAQFNYSNSGYITLGAVVEAASGGSYYDYVRTNIFRAAAMTSTDFYTRHQAMTDPRISHPYFSPTGSEPRQDVTAGLLYIGSPAGDAYSNAADLVRYRQALFGNRLLNPSFTQVLTTGKIHQPRATVPWHQSDSYAYGLSDARINGKRLVWHNGGAMGIGSELDMFPDLGVTAVHLSNYGYQALTPVIKETQELISGLLS